MDLEVSTEVDRLNTLYLLSKLNIDNFKVNFKVEAFFNVFIVKND